MRRLIGIDTSQRSPEGWVALPLLMRGLLEAERVCVQVGATRYIVGHVVRHRARWWLVPDWRVDRADLPAYEDS